MVKQLLDRQEVNLDKPDNEGCTPLSRAAGQGHESVVRQLLDRQDVDPDKPDEHGRIPLHYASSKGYEAVANLLRDREPPIPALLAVDHL